MANIIRSNCTIEEMKMKINSNKADVPASVKPENQQAGTASKIGTGIGKGLATNKPGPVK